jgi:CheY-like chemotaxis protein/signal transduction histidine kinase/HAMP domain-containing protein
MQRTFRAKLLLVVGATALAFVLLILVGELIGGQETRRLADLEGRLMPRLALGPQLDGAFEHLRRSLQDAVAAQDKEVLEGTRAELDRLLDRLSAARDVLDPGEATVLRAALEDYYRAAHDVSGRMLAGETGEAMVAAIASMQAKQVRAGDALDQATRLDPRALSNAFDDARRTRVTGSRLRLGISIACLVFVLALSLGMSRGVLRVLGELSVGLARFGRGDFSRAVAVTSSDELGTVARAANQMAENLRRAGEERDRSDWLKAGQVGLTHELRGELAAVEVAARTVRFLATYVEAPAGAFYATAEDGGLHRLGHYALGGGDASVSFRPGEGLVGQASLADNVVVIDEPPPDYLRVRSGLGEGPARAIVLCPLFHNGKARGVIELALWKPCSPKIRELLVEVRETLAIALEVARAREAMAALLEETRQLAQRLGVQEEELRASNEELQAQQEDLKLANDELAAQRHELEEQNAALESARTDLQQKAEELTSVSAYKSRFLANMSHELRTPLNSMLILSDLMAANESGNLTEKQVEFSRTIHSAGKDLLALINQVLDLSKIEAGKQTIHLEQVPVAELAAHARRIFEPQAADKGLAFEVVVDEAMPATLVTDRQRVEQIMTNLLGNAIKFTAQGQIGLTIGRAGAGARLRREGLRPERAVAFAVSDTGPGIGPDDRERIFAPFEQLEARTDRRYGGTGLGLSIARELTALLGGELQLESALGRGSTFTCFLPLDPPASAAGPRVPVVEAAASPARPALAIAAMDDRDGLGRGEEHLLVIEDDPFFSAQLAELIHDRGWKAVVAKSGEEGLRLARTLQPQGIVLDVKLPDVDGWTVMERLRQGPETSAIPVHFLSGVDAPERGWALGAVGYLTKPATRAELASVVQTLAPHATGGALRILVVEDDTERGESLVQLLAGEGLEARHVTDGHAALDALATSRWACIILDLGLPDMDGLGFLEALERRRDVETPPVVVYTGRALTKPEIRRLEAYAETVIMKDGRSAERLLDEIRQFVQQLKERVPRQRRQAAGPPAAEARLEGKTIVIADDDMRTVYALSALLRTKGAEVLMADTGKVALDVLDQHPQADAVLMDVMMPEMDGYEAMRAIRQDARFSRLPVIALTAKAMKGEREKCMEAGATAYLPKPVDNERLLATLHSTLQTPPSEGTA